MADDSLKRVRAFRKRFGLFVPTVDGLEGVIEKQGYTIVEFNSHSNDDDVELIIHELGLKDYARGSNGFTYTDSANRLVFVNEALSEEERLTVLAHEEGHIFCGHLGEADIVGRDVMQEFEANEFAHYLLKGTPFGRLREVIGRYRIISSAAVFVIAAALFFSAFTLISEADKRYYSEFYVTSTGEKYHLHDCMFIKNKTNLRRLTREEFENGDYLPCNACLPAHVMNKDPENAEE